VRLTVFSQHKYAEFLKKIAIFFYPL
jgi:hypothetical protein